MNEPLLEIPLNSNIFVLSGAGISKESGIQTFRDSEVYGIITGLRMLLRQKVSIGTLLLFMISIIIVEENLIQAQKQIKVILI